MKVFCWLRLHKYKVLKTSHEGNVDRGLLECKKCGKKFHAFSLLNRCCISKLTPDYEEYWNEQTTTRKED